MTSRPGPLPPAGVARYAWVVPPFDWKSVILPAIVWSSGTLGVVLGGAGGRRRRGRDLPRRDPAGVGLEHRDGIPGELEHLAHTWNSVEGGQDQPRHRLVVLLGQAP